MQKVSVATKMVNGDLSYEEVIENVTLATLLFSRASANLIYELVKIELGKD